MKHQLIIILIFLGLIIGYAQKLYSQALEQPQASRLPTAAEKPITSAQGAKTYQSESVLETTVEDIHFDFDKSDIRDDAKATLKKLAMILSSNPGMKVMIQGNTDDSGTAEYMHAIGDRLAKAAKSYLSSLGISPGRLKIISYGKENPLCTERTEECRARNRRVHFVLIEEK